MRPDKISIYDLFDRQRRYAVPLYQRQYEWTQEGQRSAAPFSNRDWSKEKRQVIPPVLVVPGTDTVNVSNVDLTILGHGYLSAARDLLHDIHNLINNGSPPEERFGLRRASTPEGGPIGW
jgi:hypothetical protein